MKRYAIEWLAELDIRPLGVPASSRDIGTQAVEGEESIGVEIEGGGAAQSSNQSRGSNRREKRNDKDGGLETEESLDRGVEAGLEFVCRELRLHHPDGEFDEAGRFYLSEKEARECCATIRAPSREFPFSLMKHCRTIKHVAKLYGVTEKAVKAEAEKERQQLWYLCYVRDFDRIREVIESSTLTVDPFLAPSEGLPPRAILEETRTHGILKSQVWDSLFASLGDYEKRWRTVGRL